MSLVPKFDKKEIQKYLAFGKVVKLSEWPTDRYFPGRKGGGGAYCIIFLQSVLSGKAEDVNGALSTSHGANCYSMRDYYRRMGEYLRHTDRNSETLSSRVVRHMSSLLVMTRILSTRGCYQ